MTFNLSQARSILERTPRTFRAMLAGLPSEWTDTDEGPDTWSPTVIVGHLVHGERTDWIPRARIILEHGESQAFEPFDRFAQLSDYRDSSLTDLLNEFANLRRENLEILANWKLAEAQLDLTGRHPALGVVTLRQLLSAWVAHDLGHLAQAARVMAKRYREAVGPFREYLTIMDR